MFNDVSESKHVSIVFGAWVHRRHLINNDGDGDADYIDDGK